MKFNSLFATLGVMALTATSLSASFPVTAQDSPRKVIKLCTGSEGGPYNRAGQMIASHAGASFDIEVVETAGTFANMDSMLSAGGCDAMIGQPDGPVFLKRTNPGLAAKIVPVLKLHGEYLHVLCSKEADIDNLSELSSDPTSYSVAIGPQGSGSWLIWQNIIEQDESYGEIPATADAGLIALSSVAAGQTTCMLVPSGVPNGVVLEADANFGDSVSLVSATDKDFNDATNIDGKPLYEWRDLPTTMYPVTFNRYWGSVETIGWNAGLYINKDKLNGKDLENFLRSASRARPQILAAFGK